MFQMAIFLIGLVTLFLFRSAYRIVNPDGKDQDAFAHLLYVLDIKQNHHRLPEQPSAAVTAGKYTYPPFLHWCLSFLPERVLGTVERYFSGAMDILLFTLCLALIPFDIFTASEASLSLIFMIATPQLMRFDLSHGIGLSARKPGLLFTTASLLFFLLWLSTGNWWLCALSILCGTIVYLTSKFSVQAFLFTGVSLGLFFNPTVLGLLVLSFILSTIVSFGYYIRVFIGQIRHLYTYATVTQFQQGLVPSIDDFISNSSRLVSDPIQIVYILYRSNSVRSFFFNPFIPLTLAAYGVLALGSASVTLPSGFHVWILAGLGSFALTSLPYLRFLGQPERYLEYIYLPCFVLIIYVLNETGVVFKLLMITAITGGLIINIFFIYKYFSSAMAAESDSDIEELFSYLNEQPQGVVLCQPTGISRRVAWNTSHQVVDYILNMGSTPHAIREQKLLYPDQFGSVTDNRNWIFGTYDINWVVFDKTSICKGDNKLTPPPSEPVLSNNSFEVYRSEDFST
jgi:hypothetical protein